MASSRKLINEFVTTHHVKTGTLIKHQNSITAIFQTKRAESSCVPKSVKKGRQIYQYKPTKFGVEAMCYEVSIAKLGKIKKAAPAEDVKRLKQKLEPIVSQYIDAQNEFYWHVVERTRTVPSIKAQYRTSSSGYLNALKIAFQQTKLGSSHNLQGAELNIERSLKASGVKVGRIQAKITQLVGTVISIKELKRGIKPAKDKLVKQAQSKVFSEMLAMSAKYFIGSVPIDTDGTFRVLPGSESAVMVVKRKPKGFLNNLVDRRLIVDTLLLDTNSKFVKSRGVIEFDYSKSLLDKKPIRLVLNNDYEELFKVEVLNKYYLK